MKNMQLGLSATGIAPPPVLGVGNLRRKFGVLIISFLLMYGFFVPLNGTIYDVLLFPFPDSRTPDLSGKLKVVRDSGVSVRDIYFKSANGNQLHGIYFKHPNSNRTFLFSHGRGNNIFIQVQKARQYLACGGSVFMYDYQGFGRSQGRPSITKSCEDVLSAMTILFRPKRSPRVA